MMHISYSPCFPKKIINPLFLQNLYIPYFWKIYVFGLIYVFASPYFDHDAFMHLALHVLDASTARERERERERERRRYTCLQRDSKLNAFEWLKETTKK